MADSDMPDAPEYAIDTMNTGGPKPAAQWTQESNQDYEQWQGDYFTGTQTKNKGFQTLPLRWSVNPENENTQSN